MKIDVMLTGVGGEGVLTSGVLIAKAADLQGYFVRGLQLHGLAQRGGSIHAFVRFGSEKEISSPCHIQSGADFIIAFEPLEAVHACFYARKNKTSFIINSHKNIPVYSNILNIPYPSIEEIEKRVKKFAKSIRFYDTDKISNEKFGKSIYGNTILIGIAVGRKLIPIKKEIFFKILKEARDSEKNIEAFKLGLRLAEK